MKQAKVYRKIIPPQIELPCEEEILRRAYAAMREGERLDDLQYRGMRLIQRADGYRFTSDAVLLANSVRIRKGDLVADFGAGNGVIALLCAAKTNAARIVGVEIQEDAADLARRNAQINGLDRRVEIVCADVRDATRILGKETTDAVVANPPYFANGSGLTRGARSVAQARHEQTATLRQWIRAASEVLRFGGRLYMILKCERMAEAMCEMTLADLAPKRATLIYPKAGGRADTFIVEGKKGARAGMTLESMSVCGEDGRLSEELFEMYGSGTSR